MRKLQEWMGHQHISTTQRYAAYAPSGSESEIIEAVFEPAGAVRVPIGFQCERISGNLSAPDRH